jgi:glycosyltransferase involved in cell wall biosynthesis
MKNILFLSTYPMGEAPSQRFRYEQYLPLLTKHNITYTHEPFLDKKAWNTLYLQGKIIQKVIGILRGFARRFVLLFSLKKYDAVFIHREASLIGPPIFEWYITHIAKKKVIYDFDDAIWLPNFSEANRFFHPIKMYNKVNKIMQWSSKISAGNSYLAEYARRQNPNAKITINPTTIDTENYHNKIKNQNTDKLVIGWTGTHTTMKYLDFLVPILAELEKKYTFDFLIISNQAPDIQLNCVKYKKWQKDTEIDDLLLMNIGVMPLVEDKWSAGKCGFKALQYMALGIPAVISPIGVNTKIVDEGVNGYLCSTAEEWRTCLENLMKDPSLRIKLGEQARKKIIECYSVQSNKVNFLALFD